MITWPQLTAKDFKIFEGKKVIIYSETSSAVNLYKIFKHYHIHVIGCYMEKKPRAKFVIKSRLRGLSCISKAKFLKLIQDHDNVIVQCMDRDPAESALLWERVEALGAQCSHLPLGKIESFGSHIVFFKLTKNPFIFRYKFKRWAEWCDARPVAWMAFQENLLGNAIAICSPPKTADHSINNTFEMLNRMHTQVDDDTPKIAFMNLWHKPFHVCRAQSEKNLGTLKILTGMREPISQNLSRLYQDISQGLNLTEFVYGDLEHATHKERQEIIARYEAALSSSPVDLQCVWDLYVERFVYPVDNVKKRCHEYKAIQPFFLSFHEHIVDITAYPFDQEKGYTIIKDGNTEVFLYQLEKLNQLIPALSAWVGVPFDKLENGNLASDKWIADSYKQAQKELTITQEYFDRCFNEPYVKHCYSPADIENFKAKWRPNIKLE